MITDSSTMNDDLSKQCQTNNSDITINTNNVWVTLNRTYSTFLHRYYNIINNELQIRLS